VRALALFLCLCALAAPAWATPRVQARLSQSEIELGRPFVLHITARHDPEIEVLWPDPLLLGEGLEEKSRQVLQEADGDLLVSTAEITLLAFSMETRSVPAIELVLSPTGGLLTTRVLPFRIHSHLDPEALRLRPMAAPVETPVRDRQLVGAFFLALVSIAFGLLLWRRGKRKPLAVTKADKPKVDLPAHTEALARLDALEASGALEKNTLKPAYLEMSEIFRDYLGRRFGFSCLDLTTSEIRSRLVSVEGSEEWRSAVTTWLSGCDLVKYAKSPVDPAEAQQALQTARILVERTKSPAMAQDRPREVARA